MIQYQSEFQNSKELSTFELLFDNEMRCELITNCELRLIP